VEVQFPEIDHALTGRVPHVGVGDVPFQRHCSVEDLGAARDFTKRERDMGPEAAKCLADPHCR
jgi:hypothetical protein